MCRLAGPGQLPTSVSDFVQQDYAAPTPPDTGLPGSIGVGGLARVPGRGLAW